MKRFSKITTTQLARICGVSQGTVDRALHNRPGINEKTRERILAVAREYDYVPHVKGKNAENSMLIGVVLFDFYNEFFSKLAMRLVREAKKMGYSLIFQFSEKDLDRERTAIEYFDYIGVDGIILFSAGSDNPEYENYLRSVTKPLILIGNRLFNLPYVGIDDRQAMKDVTLRLMKNSAKKDVVYYAPILRKNLNKDNAQNLRLQGFTDAMKQRRRRFRIVTDLKDLSNAGVIVCATDYYAVSVLKHLGFPLDVKISGFDNISMLENLNAPILTVEYSTDEIALECLNYILGRPYHPQIGYRLV